MSRETPLAQTARGARAGGRLRRVAWCPGSARRCEYKGAGADAQGARGAPTEKGPSQLDLEDRGVLRGQGKDSPSRGEQLR